MAQLARTGLKEIDRLFKQEVAGTVAEKIEGIVRLTAPQAIGQVSLIGVLARIQAAHPGLQFELHLEDEETNVVNEKIDIGIRHGVIRDNRFVARQVVEVPFFIVAALALLDRIGHPRSLAELQMDPVIGTLDKKTGKPWPWYFRQAGQWVPRDLAFISNSAQAECAAAVAGIGIAQLPGFLAAPHLRSGALVELLPKRAPSPWALSIYRPQRNPVPVRVRIVYDNLVNELSNPLTLPVGQWSDKS